MVIITYTVYKLDCGRKEGLREWHVRYKCRYVSSSVVKIRGGQLKRQPNEASSRYMPHKGSEQPLPPPLASVGMKDERGHGWASAAATAAKQASSVGTHMVHVRKCTHARTHTRREKWLKNGRRSSKAWRGV